MSSANDDRPFFAVLPSRATQRRSRARVFRRRPQRRFDCRTRELVSVSRHFPSLNVYLQGPFNRCDRGRPGVGRALYPRGQRAQIQYASAHHCPPDGRDDGPALVGGSIRPRDRRRLCCARRNYRKNCRRRRTGIAQARTAPCRCDHEDQSCRLRFGAAWNWHHNIFTAADADEAQRLYSAAIEADANYARAYSNMASTKFWAAQMGWADNPQSTLQAALEFARKAVALDDKDARGHFHVAQASLWLHRHDEAISEARRAIALNPSLVQAHAVLGYALDCIGEFEEALKTVTYSLRLRPYDQTIVRCIPAISIAHYQLGGLRRGPGGRAARRRNEPELLDGSPDAGGKPGSAWPQAGSRCGARRNSQERTGHLARRLGSRFVRDPIYAERVEDGLIKAGWRD